MKAAHTIPFIDIIFQALGALIVVIATLQHVDAIPVNLATVAKEAIVSKRLNDPVFLVISKAGLFLGKERITVNDIDKLTKNREVILRIDRDIPYGRVVEAVSDIQKRAKSISLEVKKNG